MHLRFLESAVNFYSHAREGRDPAECMFAAQFLYFYSHAREGRDAMSQYCISARSISTHTPARGVTHSGSCFNILSSYFYSHAREGRDEMAMHSFEKLWHFYSHAREGRDLRTSELF